MIKRKQETQIIKNGGNIFTYIVRKETTVKVSDEEQKWQWRNVTKQCALTAPWTKRWKNGVNTLNYFIKPRTLNFIGKTDSILR